ncbi:hypothetical protein RS130_19110 [Paraglaciecola aquimarina]|uniref:Uncharacterized protein n=1 Tax=Paraglaciecola aquimarina TaxID=1235557 RepID=A0ABU3T0J9_9ALTE|nr:hypothetical protein [Paraglaciecola aquimarina]MDU0355707.1 hypothetical protein [Paraglaciecola aquimarina]
MKHILISYDFLTTQAHVGKQSVEKLHFLAEILTNLGMNPTLDSDLTHVFPIKKFFELINQDYPNQMVNFVEPDINSVESNELVIDYLAGVDLLIAYELSPQSRHYFDCLGISYIDIWFSPLRFCKDVMFSFYSNVASIQKHLISNRTPDAFFTNRLSCYQNIVTISC